jgi:hypothetical protein
LVSALASLQDHLHACGCAYYFLCVSYHGLAFLITEEEINGEAFKDLSVEELEKMGFKTGPRKNIMSIIKTCTVTLEVRVLSIGCMNDNIMCPSLIPMVVGISYNIENFNSIARPAPCMDIRGYI